LNVLANRLVRAVDRYRLLNGSDNPANQTSKELYTLPYRVYLIRWAISLCTFCAILLCIAIVTLFLGGELGIDLSRVISVLFIGAMLSLTVALLCFLREITLAAAAVEIKRTLK
jgi:hypothetical protein